MNMWKSIELHNHTVESDGSMTVTGLVRFLASNNIRSFSLTDHNTISGWRQLPEAVREISPDSEFICGYELTSYFGHMLCQNIDSYIPWDDIDADCADPLFQRVHEAGGLAGPAHPCSIPFPFSTGMRWSMRIHDHSLIDFIEIINNAHPMIPDNKSAILWWEDLIFQGYHIAATSGLDLHQPQLPDHLFTTFLRISDPFLHRSLKEQLEHSIKNTETCVTRGPVADWFADRERLYIRLEPGLTPPDIHGSYLCELRTKQGRHVFSFDGFLCILPTSVLSEIGQAALFFIYQDQADWEHLICIARPFFRPDPC